MHQCNDQQLKVLSDDCSMMTMMMFHWTDHRNVFALAMLKRKNSKFVFKKSNKSNTMFIICQFLNYRFNSGSAAPSYVYTNTFANAIDERMANCSLVTTAPQPVNQNNFGAASTMNAANSSFIINQPFSIHYTGPVTAVQPVLPQFYIYLPTQLNSIENQYLLINTMDPVPSSRNMQVSSLYGTVDGTMAFQTTNAYTYNRKLHEHFNISVNDTL